MNSDTQVVILEGKDSGAGVKLARAVQADGGARAYVLQACRAASLQAAPVAWPWQGPRLAALLLLLGAAVPCSAGTIASGPTCARFETQRAKPC